MSSTSNALLALINQFNSTPGYTAKSDAELRAQAANEYASYYGNLRLSAKQAHDRNNLALQQSRQNLAKSYDKQREASAQQYASAYSQTDRQMLGRGMQRSSYGSQTLANLLEAGAQAQQDIYDAQTDAERQIDAQIALLAQQLSDQLMQYDASEQSDILARLWTLQQQEYDRSVAAQDRQNSLAAQIYQYQYQEGRDQVADSQWQQQMDFQKSQANADAARWQAQMEYQAGRDKVADEQWQQQYDESVRQWQAEMDYQAGRDQVSDSQWQQQLDFNKSQAQADADRWQAEMDYQAGRDQTQDEQWQKQYDEGVRQWQAEMDFQKQQYEDKQAKSNASSSSSTSGAKTGATSTAVTGGMTWADFIAALGGSTAPATSGKAATSDFTNTSVDGHLIGTFQAGSVGPKVATTTIKKNVIKQ